jgi:pimeloyl-ACP methyl ester carboxylesterase
VDQFHHGGLTFDVREVGPAEGEAVILLHGYPQTKAAWSEVAPALAEAGYRVLAPDQRGFSPLARPKGRKQYRIDRLVGDVLALADEAGADRVHLVGHDWGGAVAWAFAMWNPSRLLSVTSLTTPHQKAYLRALFTSRQFFMSWYALFFQLPLLPEWSARIGPMKRSFERALVRSGLPETYAAQYQAIVDQPEAITATINWYRAGVLTPFTRYCVVSVPTLYVYATGDVALGRKAADLTGRYVTGPYRYEVLEGMCHWIPEVAPNLVAGLLLEHFSNANAS